MIVLDTHVLLWWLAGTDDLTTAARRGIEAQAGVEAGIRVSSISAWEIAMLVQKGRLALSVDVSDWIRHAEQVPSVTFERLDNNICVQSTMLPEPFHKDPADRFIVATARELNCPLVTADRKLLSYRHVETIW